MGKKSPKDTRSHEEASQNPLSEEILQLLKKRDKPFLEKLFLEVNPYLVRVSLANGIEADQAKDLIHQTWETFFINLEKFEGRSQIRTFLCGILFNKIREHRRLEKRFVYEEDSEKFMNHAFTPDGWWKVPPSDPCRIAELKETSEFVKECIEGLSEQQMTAFIMKEVEEEESESICNFMGVNVSHLRVLLFRAKDKLRTCLEGKVSVEQG
jgi:RNA polymerase sigma-70 factor (ECF subfamily)